MADETIELTEVQAILDGLSSPTDEQFVQAVRGYSDGAVASAAAKLALAGGGGAGALPAWWTVDSTPGSESVDFSGGDLLGVGELDAESVFIGADAAESQGNKDQASGYAGLDGDSLLDAAQIPPLSTYLPLDISADKTVTIDPANTLAVEYGPAGPQIITFQGSELAVEVASGADTIVYLANGTGAKVSFFGVVEVAQQAAPADVNDVIAGLQALGLFAV